jgi:DNA (cytosine-5)-methyltransferase 1
MRIGDPSFLDFFAGSGLVTEAFSGLFHPVWANDICPKKAWVYRANHGNGHFTLDDIAQVNGVELPHADLSWASFPCQDLSLAGKQVGITAARSGLIWQWLRILDESACKPVVVCLENVPGLVAANGGRDYLVIHNELTSRGYRVGAVIIDAALWVPQSRSRVFVVGVLDSSAEMEDLTGIGPGWMHPQSIIRMSQAASGWIWWNCPSPKARRQKLESLIEWKAPCDPDEVTGKLLSTISATQAAKLADAMISGTKAMPAYRRTRGGKPMLELRFDGIAGCLRTPEGGSSRQRLLLIGEDRKLRSRLLTAREAARLMGASDTYILPEGYNDAYRAMGDGVVVPVARYLAETLLLPLVTRILNERTIANRAVSAA